MTFKDRLREEISYNGMLVKEISAKVGISNSTFLSYIDSRGIIPNAETAVKIAKVLNVTVEYLVTGEDSRADIKNQDIHQILLDLDKLDESELKIVKNILHVVAEKKYK